VSDVHTPRVHSELAFDALWHRAAVDLVLSEASRAGAGQTFLIAPYPIEAGELAGAAVRDLDPRPSDLGDDLARLLGARALASTCVALVDCFGQAPAHAIAHEIATLVGRCAVVVVVERQAAHGPAPEPTSLLAPFGIVAMRDRAAGTPAGRSRVMVFGDRGASGPIAPGTFDVFLMDWHGKARTIADALVAGGHRLVGHPAIADVAMINNDYPGLGRLPYLDACVDNGGRAYLYPDGAASTLMAAWDGLYEPYARLSGVLACAPGHVEVARRYGYPHPVHVVGWGMCGLRSRRAGGPLRRVLLAPEHPPYHGNPRPPVQNAAALRGLLDAGVEVTVRVIGDIAENGLWADPRVAYVHGETGHFDEMIAQIDAHDAVLATSTFACLAVARGVTTVMWNTDVQYHHETNAVAAHIDDYRDYVRYPFDLSSGRSVADLLEAANDDEARAADWRARFVGVPLDPVALTAAIGG
jgi:hypothetical protein